jgi:Transglycosylase SLT domain
MGDVLITGNLERIGIDTLVIIPNGLMSKGKNLSLPQVLPLLEELGSAPSKKDKTAVLTDEKAAQNPRVQDFVKTGLRDRPTLTIFLNPEAENPSSLVKDSFKDISQQFTPVQSGGFATTTFGYSSGTNNVNLLFFHSSEPPQPGFLKSPVQSAFPTVGRLDLLSTNEKGHLPPDIAQRLNRLYNIGRTEFGANLVRHIHDASRLYGIDERLSLSQLMQESSLNPNAVGPQTRYGMAKGMGQFIDATFHTYFRKVTLAHPELKLVENPFDPRTAAYLHAAYMRDNLQRFRGNSGMALAAYNWGEGNVEKSLRRHGIDSSGNPAIMPRETEGYLRNILTMSRELDMNRLIRDPQPPTYPAPYRPAASFDR